MAVKARKTRRNEYSSHERAVIKKSGMDVGFLATVIALVIFGLLMVFSASYPSANYRYGDGLYFITRQAIWAVLGVIAMMITARIDYRAYKRLYKPIMLITFILLGLVLLSTPLKGARRWLGFGAFTIQPSEIAKISVIIFFAKVLCDAKEKIKDISYLIKYGAVLLGVLVLLILEPHFSVCIIICYVACCRLSA